MRFDRRLLATSLVAALAAVAPAQSPRTPANKIQRGFAALSQGSWAQALGEWNQDGLLAEERLEESRAQLERLAPQPRTIGEWGAVRRPLQQRLWQRHWLMATFDRGAVFASFDFVLHKGEWRLLRVAATQDPGEILHALDTPAVAPERD